MALRPFIAPFALGFVSVIAQVTAVRSLLTAFTGNELIIGLVLSLWLLFTGAGSYAGRKTKSRSALPVILGLLGIFFAPWVFLLNNIGPAFGMPLGESASFAGTLAMASAGLFPACFAMGFIFPLAVRRIEEGSDIPNPAGKAYSLESGGAFLGGALFTFVLAGRIGSLECALICSVASVMSMPFVMDRRRYLPLILIPALALVYLGAKKAGEALDEERFSGLGRPERTASRHAEILVLRGRGQTAVYYGGGFLYSYPSPEADEPSAHAPMLAAEKIPRRILAIGAGPGVLAEFLRYPVAGLAAAEPDPGLAGALKGILPPGASSDKRLRLIPADGRRFIKESGETFDLIAVYLPGPETADLNRYYTVEFFREARRLLGGGGAIFLRAESSPGYMGRRMMYLNGSIYASLRAAFKHVYASTEEYGFFLASDSELTPGKISERLAESGMGMSYFHPSIAAEMFRRARAEAYEKKLAESGELNTDAKPAAYLGRLMLWAEAEAGGATRAFLSTRPLSAIILLAALSVALAAFSFWKKGRALGLSIASTGYADMTVSVVILLGFQSATGYVYEAIGLLTALFMAGAAIGAWRPIRAGNPMKNVLIYECAWVLFAGGAAFVPATAVSYYLLSLLAGALMGGAYSASARAVGTGESAALEGGRLYSLDLAGSFLGGFLAAVLLVPLLGIQGALLLTAGLKAVASFATAYAYAKD